MFGFQRHAIQFALTLGSIVLLAVGCGGNGGDDNPDPIPGPGPIGPVNASKHPGRQAEPAVAVRLNPANPVQSQIVIVAMDPDHPPEAIAMLQMVSHDSGATWHTREIANGQDGLPPAAGDSDPALVFDRFGNLFLAYRSRLEGTVLLLSENAGSTWEFVPGFSSLPDASGATPKVATGPSGVDWASSSVWVTMNRRVAEGAGLITTGTAVSGLGADNISPDWTEPAVLPNSSLDEVVFSNMAIGPAGQVVVSHIIGSGPSRRQAPVTCYTALDLDGLAAGTFSSRASFTIRLGWEYLPAHGFEAVPIPVLGWDRARDWLYVGYPGKTGPLGEENDNTDIFVRVSTDAAGTWSEPIRVNDDETGRSQFHPWLAVDQQSGHVALAWYDARNDPENRKTHFYAAISTDQFASPMPDNFRVSTGESLVNTTSRDLKEYIGLDFFKGWIYPAWLDNSNSTGDNPDGTLTEFDIYVARMAP